MSLAEGVQEYEREGLTDSHLADERCKSAVKNLMTRSHRPLSRSVRSNRRELAGESVRQAVPSLQGYIYQAWCSIDAWLQLAKGEIIYLEGAEDFDIVGPDRAIAKQVKHVTEPLSLGTRKARDALTHFWKLQLNEPSRKVTYHYLTTASEVMEQDAAFNGKRGIDAWRAADTSEQLARAIQTYLVRKLELGSPLQSFAASASVTEFQDRVIRRFCWFTDYKSIRNVKQSVDDNLTHKLVSLQVTLPQMDRVKDRLESRFWATVALQKSSDRRLTAADLIREIKAATTYLLEVPAQRVDEMLRVAHSTDNRVALRGVLPPPPANRFVGRSLQIRTIKRLILREQLVTLIGPPGVGKSRLAIEVAQRISGGFAAGAAYVPLESVNSPDLVLSAIADALHVRDFDKVPLLMSLQRSIAEASILCILDNFDHVLDAASDLSKLLASCPDLHVLVTSQTPLNIVGEHLHRLQPLDCPATSPAVDLRRLAKVPAVALLVDRVQRHVKSFQLTRQNSKAVVEICNRSDGLPLAIQLYAPLMRILSPQELVQRWGSGPVIPNQSPRDSGPRHASLQAAIAPGYSRMGIRQQSLFRCLAVFRGGADIDAVQAIVTDAKLAIALLSELIGMSFVERIDSDKVSTRYRLLRILREFGEDELRNRGELAAAKFAHARYFALVSEKTEALLIGREQAKWFTALSAESDNLRASLDCFEESGDINSAARMAGALSRLWYVQGHLSEARQRFARLLDWPNAALESDVRAKMLTGAGILARDQGDYFVARSLLSESIYIYRAAGLKSELARALYHLGILEGRCANQDASWSLHSESLRIAKRIYDNWAIGSARRGLSHVLSSRTMYSQARDELSKSLEHFRISGDQRGLAISLRFAGQLSIDLQDWPAAHSQLSESMTLLAALDDRWSVSNVVMAFARLALAENRISRAARLLGAAGALRASVGVPLPVGEQRRADSLLHSVQSQFGIGEQDALLIEGKRLTVHQIIEYSLFDKWSEVS